MSIAKWLLAKKLGGGSPFPPVIKRVTGNPIEFEDGANAPLVKCVTQITGSQDLHGYDKPWVGGAGKNKLTLSVDEIKALNTSGTWTGNVYAVADTTFTIETDNGGNVTSIVVNGTTDNNYQQLDIPINNSLMGTEIILSKGNVNNYVITGVLQNGSTKIVCITTEVTGTIPDSGTISSYVRLTANRTVNNVRVYPMIRLSTVTDPTYAPYSNICPITAYTEGEIEVRGKNILNDSDKYFAGGSIRFGGATTALEKSLTLSPGTYTFSVVTANGEVTNLYLNDIDTDTPISGFPAYNSRSKTFTLTEMKNISAWVYKNTYTSVGDIVSAQIEKGSTPTTYEPYTSTTHTTTYPSAIYRGSEDVVNGEVTSEMPIIDLGDLSWNYANNTFYATLPSDSYKYKTNVPSLCSHYNYIGTVNNGTSDMQNVDDASYALYFNTNYPTSRVLYVKDTRYTDASTFTTAVTGVQLAYELATPTTSSVTPTNLPIKSLSGYNHIESSTGDMTIDYITEGYQNFVNTVESALPNTRKGGVKAFDIFATLDNPSTDSDKDSDEDDKKEEVKEEIKDDMR